MNHRAHTAASVSLILVAFGCGASGSVTAHRDGSADSAGPSGESGASSGGSSSGGTTSDASDGASASSPDAQDAGVAEGGGDAATNADAGDATAPTCHACAVKNCPTQVAACVAGSPCMAFLQCEFACSSDGGSNCSNTCGAMDPSGQAAFAALTLCDLGPCGAGCVALLAIQGP